MVELDTKKIVAGIELLFTGNNNFVFWYDANGDFTDNMDEIAAQLREPVVVMGKNEQFKTKLTLVAMEQKCQPALVYSPCPKPEARLNFLTDMLYYSREYTADALVMLQQELQVPSSDSAAFREQRKFFGSKERIAKFKKVYVPGSNLAMAVMAALAGAGDHTMTAILRAVLAAGLGDDNAILAEFTKYGLTDQFWANVRAAYGFQGIKESLKQLATALYLNFTFNQMAKDLPDSLANYRLSRLNNALTFLSQARNDQTYAHTYQAEADQVWAFIDGGKLFKTTDIADLIDTDVFSQFDRRILTWAVDRLQAGDYQATAGKLNLPAILAKRGKTMYYHGRFHDAYALLTAAITVLSYHHPASTDLPAATMQYVQHGASADQAYRHYTELRDGIAVDLDGIFDALTDLVNTTYVNQDLTPMITDWTAHYDPTMIQMNDWQRNFYRTYISNTPDRTVVIISDAFRYEAAAELKEQLDAQDVFTTTMATIYTGLPSVTYFGMPALLPHGEMHYVNGHVLTVGNGGEANTLVKRQDVLQAKNPASIAVHLTDFLNWSTEERKQHLAGQKVVYMYHNDVDATGDDAKKQEQVFAATTNTIETIMRVVEFLRNLSVVRIIVTADHGYIYQRSKLDSADKIDLGEHHFDTQGQRYAISADDIQLPGVLSQRLGTLLDNHDSRRIYYPATNSIFVSAGAAQNYVHGGASPQEMIVPVLQIATRKGKSQASPVAVKIIAPSHRITSKSIQVPISQEVPVSDTATAATYRIYFVDNQNRTISNIDTYFADSTAPQPKERIQNLYMTLKDQSYDNSASYALVVENADTAEEVVRIPYQMDLTIGGGFGFDI